MKNYEKEEQDILMIMVIGSAIVVICGIAMVLLLASQFEKFN